MLDDQQTMERTAKTAPTIMKIVITDAETGAPVTEMVTDIAIIGCSRLDEKLPDGSHPTTIIGIGTVEQLSQLLTITINEIRAQNQERVEKDADQTNQLEIGGRRED